MTIVMTPIMRGDCALHALKVRGVGLAWGSGAPVAVARRADSHCTCCGSMQAFPRTLVHDIMSETPLPTLALGRSAKRALYRALEQRKTHDVLDIPTTKRQRARDRGGHMQAPGRAAPTPSSPSAQREAATGLPQAPGRAARPCHRRRARSARRRWQPAAAPPGTGARSVLGAHERRVPSAELSA